MQPVNLRVAMIGLGLWGMRAHLPAFSAHPGVEVVALVDPDAERLQAASEQFSIGATFQSAGELLSNGPDMDALVIATPDDTHHDLVMAAFEAGLDVFCEKPLAYNVEQAEAMVEAAESRQRVTKIGFLFRFSPVVERMKRLIEMGYIGQVQLFESLTVNAQFIDPERPIHWKMQREHANGGVFVEYGSHTIDLANWLGGKIVSVVADGVTLVPKRPDPSGGVATIDVDDAASWIAVFEHGGQALFRTGWTSLPVGSNGLRVFGSQGSLAWQLDPTGRRSEKLLGSTIDEPEPKVLLEFAPPYDPVTDSGTFPLGLLARYNRRLVDSFVKNVRTRTSSGPNFSDGLASQRVLAAIRTSLDERRWVDL